MLAMLLENQQGVKDALVYNYRYFSFNSFGHCIEILQEISWIGVCERFVLFCFKDPLLRALFCLCSTEWRTFIFQGQSHSAPEQNDLVFHCEVIDYKWDNHKGIYPLVWFHVCIKIFQYLNRCTPPLAFQENFSMTQLLKPSGY